METPTAFIGVPAEAESLDIPPAAPPVAESQVAAEDALAAEDVPADELGPHATPDTPSIVDDEDGGDVEDSEARVTDSDLLLRLSLLVDTMLDEMRRSEDLSGRAVGRARDAVKTVVAKIPDAVSTALAAEATALFADLPDDADEAEVRMALCHVVGWFNGIFQSLRMMNPDQIRAALQAGMAAQAPAPQALGAPGPSAPGYI